MAILERDYAKAEDYFAKILQLQADFLLAKLELARCQFLRHKNLTALANFKQIQQQVAKTAQGNSLNKSLNAYIHALDKRDAWQGKISVGMQYNSNINQSSGEQQEINLGGGFKFIRKAPDIQSGTGLTYNLSLAKHISHYQQQGTLFSAYLSGIKYAKRLNNFTQNKAGLGFAYRHHRGIDQLDIGMGTEILYVGKEQLNIPITQGVWRIQGKPFYHLFKANLGYRYFYSTTVLGGDFLYERKYHQNNQYANNDGDSYKIELSLYQQLANWLLFASTHYEQQKKQLDFFNYNQWGANIGSQATLFKRLTLTLFVNVHEQKYQRYNALLGTKRNDVLRTFGMYLSPVHFFDFAIKPSLQLSHHYQTSNVPWLYSYRQSSAAINLDYRF